MDLAKLNLGEQGKRLKLPAEIKKSIHQHCFSLRRHNPCFLLKFPAMLDVDTSYSASTNKAMSILYNSSMSATMTWIPFRLDETATRDHSLRNGRRVSTTGFTAESILMYWRGFASSSFNRRALSATASVPAANMTCHGYYDRELSTRDSDRRTTAGLEAYITD